MLSVFVCAVGLSLTGGTELPAPLGSKVLDFTLTNASTGKPWSLSEVPQDGKATVIAFLATGCPVNNAYLPRLAEYYKRFKNDGVTFIGVNCHPGDTLADVAKHAAKYAVPFPVLKDEGGKLAKRLNVERVPTVLVLDAGKQVRYFGRIDDQFAPGVQRAKATTRDLANAIDAVVEKREVKTPFVAAAGCLFATEKAPKVETKATYHREVSRIIQAKCQECHRPGEAAPFTLMTYQNAKSWSAMIREVVADDVMPPWHADAPRGHFLNDRRLSLEDKATLLAWVDAGCPEGNPADAPPAKVYAKGWRLGREPDKVVKVARPIDVPAQFMYGAIGMPYQYVGGDQAFPEDTWVQGFEVRPDYREAIHHILVFVVPPGKRLHELAGHNGEEFARLLLAAYVPGDAPTMYPDGYAKRIPAGGKLLFEVHYTPNGKAGVDRSSVGLILAKSPPKYEVKTDSNINHRIRIPAGAANHQEGSSDLVYDRPVTIVNFTPHMHLRGKAFKMEVVAPDGKRETVLNVPHYDFNWQVGYVPAKPVVLPAGHKVVSTAWYDNSTGNPANPDATKNVRWGNQTYEEMMIGFIEYFVER